jgi:maltose O-acetyltransferase
MKKINLFVWYMLARFLPGHAKKSMLGRFRTWVAGNCLGSAGKSIAVGQLVDFGNGRNIHLGNNAGIGNYSVVKGSAQIVIGDNVTMGPGVMILSSSHEFKYINSMWTDADVSRPIVIKGDCFIGAGSLILAGVTIEMGVVIAAGSVVTQSIPSGMVVGGVPAKVLRQLSSE